MLMQAMELLETGGQQGRLHTTRSHSNSTSSHSSHVCQLCVCVCRGVGETGGQQGWLRTISSNQYHQQEQAAVYVGSVCVQGHRKQVQNGVAILLTRPF